MEKNKYFIYNRTFALSQNAAYTAKKCATIGEHGRITKRSKKKSNFNELNIFRKIDDHG